ncbi:MAG: hypothetical protein HQM09_17490 [Candidatus Riflebacteria bacterium]|nr:hypothetical protein [Candidatus Riflebacteria bacterium]
MEQASNVLVAIDFADVFRILSTTTRVQTFVWNGKISDTIHLSASNKPEWPVKRVIVHFGGEKTLGIREVSRLLQPFEDVAPFELEDDDSPIIFGISVEPVPAGTIEVRAVFSG